MELLNDDKLVSLAKNGNEFATEELMKRYGDSVKKIARSFFLVGGDIEDIAQEGLIGLYKAIKNFNPEREASFKTFAGLCIKHQIQNLIKQAGSLKNKLLREAIALDPVLADEAEGIFVAFPVDNHSPETALIAKEDITEFYKKIQTSLSETEKKVLSLYLKGYSYDEISKELNSSKKNVDNALTRVKNKLSVNN